jgi:hypothetical protein
MMQDVLMQAYRHWKQAFSVNLSWLHDAFHIVGSVLVFYRSCVNSIPLLISYTSYAIFLPLCIKDNLPMPMFQYLLRPYDR